MCWVSWAAVVPDISCVGNSRDTSGVGRFWGANPKVVGLRPFQGLVANKTGKDQQLFLCKLLNFKPAREAG